LNNKIDLLSLQVFCCVARRASFVAASQELKMSPASVSMRIADLERAFGLTLFHRTTRRVRISDQGELLYACARKILDDFDDMNNVMSSTKTDPSGPLRVSASPLLARQYVCPLLCMFGIQFPKLDIWVDSFSKPLDLIEEGIDIDIRSGQPNEPHLIAHHIAKNDRILCAAPSYLAHRGHPGTAAELAYHDCLLYRERDQPYGVWSLDGPDGLESVKVTARAGSNQSELVRVMALNGYGIILFSEWVVADDIRNGRLVQVLPSYSQPADIWAVTTTRLAGTAKVRLSLEFLAQQLRAGPFALQRLKEP
jgi:LysR family transcriptional activator of dmlA